MNLWIPQCGSVISFYSLYLSLYFWIKNWLLRLPQFWEGWSFSQVQFNSGCILWKRNIPLTILVWWHTESPLLSGSNINFRCKIDVSMFDCNDYFRVWNETWKSYFLACFISISNSKTREWNHLAVLAFYRNIIELGKIFFYWTLFYWPIRKGYHTYRLPPLVECFRRGYSYWWHTTINRDCSHNASSQIRER